MQVHRSGPLSGEPERAFEFVQGLGEYLPFRDEWFDQVLFATSLDHMLVPRRALAEALRVLAPGGAINVWFGELDRPPQGGAVRRARHRVGAVIDRIRTEQPQEPEYLAALERPQGAIDKFHVAQPGEREIAGWFADLGLELSAAERIDYCSGCSCAARNRVRKRSRSTSQRCDAGRGDVPRMRVSVRRSERVSRDGR